MRDHRITDKEVREIVRWATQELGFRALHSKSHGKLLSPDGKSIVVFHYTPSDWRAYENLRHGIVRAARTAGISV